MSEAEATPAPRKRRWFAFSLRTMLVVMTVVCCWLAYQLNWIRERQAILAAGHSWMDGDTMSASILGSRPPAPWPLRVFGEAGSGEIVIFIKRDDERAHVQFLTPVSDATLTPIEKAHRERVSSLFPEALVKVLFY